MAVKFPGAHFVTPEQIENARRNIERFSWAAEERDAAVERARRWTRLDDETLWSLVTGQNIGRSTNASVAKGCPACGEDINRHGGKFEVDILADPWKIKCPNCGGRFPTNDFAAFYESGKGPDGLFHPEHADRNLLFNTEHPDPDDPLHTWGVDDGTGWTDETGESFKLIGVYGHYGVWTEVSKACDGLREAYLLTGDPVFAHKAGLLLARIADVYPDMDWSFWSARGFFNSDGLSGRGRIYGRIWEPGLLTTFAHCYDAVRAAWKDGDPLFSFLAQKQTTFGLSPQDSVESLSRHVEEHILQEGIRGIVKGDVARNEPGDQVTMAVLAVALDNEETDGWLDWVFKEGKLKGETPGGGHIPRLFASEIDRDGVGSEAAPSYSLGWLYKNAGMNDLEHALSARPSYTRHSIRSFSRYKQMFLGHVRMLVLGKYIPPIGDTGKTGAPDLCGLRVSQCLEGLELFGDPVFARAAHHLVDGNLSRIHGSVFDTDPEAVRNRVEQIVTEHGPLRLESDLMTGYGLALLRDGEAESERTLWIYHGRNTGHGHADRLNLGLYGFGLDLLPDLGYPEHARVWPKRSGWTKHTVSHNTVLVDRAPQTGSYSGKVDFTGASPQAQAVAISSPDVYPQCSVYGRCAALVRVSETDFYAVDLFRVTGGKSHHFLFHAAEGNVETSGLDLVPQEKGTCAGENVSFGEFYDDPDIRRYRGSGFQYLYDVKRCPKPARAASVDWTLKDTWQALPESSQRGAPTDIHLRWTLFNPPGEIALCHGDPPQNKPGNPRRLVYAVAAHEGEPSLDSGFLSLIEAFKSTRVIQNAEELSVPQETVRALKIHLPNNRTDTVLFGDGGTTVQINGLEFNGRFGIYSETSGQSAWAFLVGGTVLGTKDRAIRAAHAAWTGTVSAREPGRIYTSEAPPPEDLTGAYISVENDNERDACYRIETVRRDGDRTLISVGDVDFIRGMVDDLDYTKGFLYDFEPGQTFRVVLSRFQQWTR